MIFLGTLVNFATIIVGAILGSLLKKGLPERISKSLTSGMGLCVIFIGISGFNLSYANLNALIVVLSIAIGVIVGELLKFDDNLNRFGCFLQKKLTKSQDETNTFGKGFINCTLIFCIGAMAINGALQGAQGEHSIFFAKAIIDGVTVVVLSSTFGIGCILSAFSTAIYQGLLTLIFYFIINSVDQTNAMYITIITHIGTVGSLLIMAIGSNMLGVAKIKIANLIPAMIVPLGLCPLFALLGI